jgi:hypothetical protein
MALVRNREILSFTDYFRPEHLRELVPSNYRVSHNFLLPTEIECSETVTRAMAGRLESILCFENLKPLFNWVDGKLVHGRTSDILPSGIRVPLFRNGVAHGRGYEQYNLKEFEHEIF